MELMKSYADVCRYVRAIVPFNFNKRHLKNIIRAVARLRYSRENYPDRVSYITAVQAAERCHRSLCLELNGSVSVENVRFLVTHFLCHEAKGFYQLSDEHLIPWAMEKRQFFQAMVRLEAPVVSEKRHAWPVLHTELERRLRSL